MGGSDGQRRGVGDRRRDIELKALCAEHRPRTEKITWHCNARPKLPVRIADCLGSAQTPGHALVHQRPAHHIVYVVAQVALRGVVGSASSIGHMRQSNLTRVVAQRSFLQCAKDVLDWSAGRSCLVLALVRFRFGRYVSFSQDSVRVRVPKSVTDR